MAESKRLDKSFSVACPITHLFFGGTDCTITDTKTGNSATSWGQNEEEAAEAALDKLLDRIKDK